MLLFLTISRSENQKSDSNLSVGIDQCWPVSIDHGHGRDWSLPFSQFWPISNDNQGPNLVTARPVTVGHEHRDADA